MIRQWMVVVAITCGGWLSGSLSLAQTAPPASSAEAVEQYRVAEQYQKLGEFDLAYKEWTKLAEEHANDPLAPTAEHFAGVCQYQLGNYKAAAEHFSLATTEHASHPLMEASLTNLGLSYFNHAQQAPPDQRERLYEQAIEAFDRQRKAFAQGKFAAQGGFYRAESLYLSGKSKEAVTAYQEWLAEYPGDPLARDVQLALGATQTELGNTKEAIATLTKLRESTEQGATDPEIALRLGTALVEDGQFEGGAEQLAVAVAASGFPDADYAMEQQAAALFQAGEYRNAADLYAALPERFPQSNFAASSHASAGKSYYQAGDYEAAATHLKHALGAAPQDADLAHWYVRTLLKQGKPEEALAALDQFKTESGSPRLLVDRADALYELPAQRDKSVAVYVAAADQAEGELAAEALHLAAATALELGNHQKAADLAERLARQHGESGYALDARQTLAEAKLQLGDAAAAAKLYRDILPQATDAQKIRWTLRLAWALTTAGDPAEVIDTLEPLVSRLPAESQAEGNYLLGRALLASNRASDAVQPLTAAAESKQDAAWSSDARMQLAKAQQQTGQLDAALATLDQMSNALPEGEQQLTALFHRAEVRQQAGDTAGARADYLSVARRTPDGKLAPYAGFRAASLAVQAGDWQTAAQELTSWLDRYNDHPLAPDAQLVRGTALAQLREYDNAIAALRAAANATGEFASRDRALYELAWAYRDSQRPEDSDKVFAQLAEDFPQSTFAAEAHYRLGESYYNGGKFEESLESFRKARQHPSGDAKLREKGAHLAAWSQFKHGDAAAAAESFAAQRKEFPEGVLAADAAWMEGIALYGAEEYAEALAAFEQARDAQPSTPQLVPLGMLNAGQAAGKLEKWDQSVEWLERVREEFRDYDGRNQVEYELAWGLTKLGKSEAAQGLFEGLADRDSSPLGARAQFMVGELQFANRDYEQAVRSFFKVSSGYQYPNSPAEYHPWQAESMFEAARCLEQLKRSTAAVKLYRELVERFPDQPKAKLAQERLQTLAPKQQ